MVEIDAETKKLLDEMGFVPSTKSPKLYEIEIKDGFAYVDFRKVDGRRFAMIKNKPVDDEDTIPILAEFKKRRAEIEKKLLNNIGVTSQSSKNLEDSKKIDDTSGQEKQPIPPSDKVSTPITPASSVGGNSHNPPIPVGVQIPSPPNLYEFFLELVEEGGIIELFADTGFLKTTTCVKTVCDAIAKGKKAFFIDTEGKAGLHNKRMLKAINSYSYLPIWNDIVKAVEALGKYDLLIIDSIGFPISAKASGMDMHEQGKAWNQMMSLIGDTAKAWAFKNNAIVLFTNQPKSEMMKSEEELKRLDAVGDKVHFAPTIILKAVDKGKVPGHYDAKTQKASLPETVVTLLSHRNPDFMDDTIMAKIYKQDENVHIEIPENVKERLKVLKQ